MTAETLLNDLRILYRRHPSENAPGEFQRVSDAYRATLALLDIHERQRENVYAQTLYGGITLDAAIVAARRRENTRTIRLDSHGIRIETVRGLCSPEHYTVEAYDTATGVMVASLGGIPTEWLDRYAADLWAEVWNNRQDEAECDGCYVQPDGTHDDGTMCPCAAGLTVNPKACRCQPSPNEWHGPAYVRAEMASREI